MSATVDANLLLYASDADSELHERAGEVLAELAQSPGLLYLFWPVTMAYLRIATHPAVFRRPLAPDVACTNIEHLLERPNVRAPGEESGFWRTYRGIAGNDAIRGNLVPDAHLVALMRQYGVRTIFTRDRDFRRFNEVEPRDPFE